MSEDFPGQDSLLDELKRLYRNEFDKNQIFFEWQDHAKPARRFSKHLSELIDLLALRPAFLEEANSDLVKLLQKLRADAGLFSENETESAAEALEDDFAAEAMEIPEFLSEEFGSDIADALSPLMDPLSEAKMGMPTNPPPAPAPPSAPQRDTAPSKKQIGKPGKSSK